MRNEQPQYRQHVETVFTYHKPFTLDTGLTFQELKLAYTTYGFLNEDKSNVIWVFHALTANSNVHEWWPGLIGENKLLDTNKYFIICVNMPGSCYGSSYPLDINPQTNTPYYHSFPLFTIRDMVKAYQLLMEDLGIKKIKLGIGGSMGGQQLLEWASWQPDLFEHIVLLATNAVHSSWGKAFNAAQRIAIEADSTWLLNAPLAGQKGMEVARTIGLLSYRTAKAYNLSQVDNNNHLENYKAESYLRHQGKKLSQRFNAFSYYMLSKSMDSHFVGRELNSPEKALGSVTASALVLSLEEDILFPKEEQQFIAQHIHKASFKVLHSSFGHDGFLLEEEQIIAAVKEVFPWV